MHLLCFHYFDLLSVEEESVESGSFSVGHRSSGRSSLSSDNTGEDYNSLKHKKKGKEKKEWRRTS